MSTAFDFVVIGGGPAGQKAAIQAVKAGKSAALIEEQPGIGGECVQRGTIPSKTLRETALALTIFQQKTGGVFGTALQGPTDVQLDKLMARKDDVIAAHERYMGEQMRRNGVVRFHGRASFTSPHDVDVVNVRGERQHLSGDVVIIATGSRPRTPPEIPVDHENILDSDSILSMMYLPSSLCVLGAGVIAVEYASIFAALGVKVVVVDKGERPVPFLDAELTTVFTTAFERAGGRFLGGRSTSSVAWDGIDSVVIELADGEVLRAEKVLCALGRVARSEGLALNNAGVSVNARGLIEVDGWCRTAVPHIYAVGDIIGPPSLASSSMEQGRRAARHALGMDVSTAAELIPVGVYTMPEMSSVGLSEADAIARHGGAMVGRARFDEVARGQIAGSRDGLLKIVADANGDRLLGVQIVGEGACELIHVGQIALLAGLGVDVFIDNIMNFPTLAEAYRVAALDIAGKIARAAAPRA